jgi:hypothetical protein
MPCHALRGMAGGPPDYLVRRGSRRPPPWQGRAPVKLGALRRRSRGERAPVKLGALCPRSGRGPRGRHRGNASHRAPHGTDQWPLLPGGGTGVRPPPACLAGDGPASLCPQGDPAGHHGTGADRHGSQSPCAPRALMAVGSLTDGGSAMCSTCACLASATWYHHWTNIHLEAQQEETCPRKMMWPAIGTTGKTR